MAAAAAAAAAAVGYPAKKKKTLQSAQNKQTKKKKTAQTQPCFWEATLSFKRVHTSDRTGDVATVLLPPNQPSYGRSTILEAGAYF